MSAAHIDWGIIVAPIVILIIVLADIFGDFFDL